MKTIQMTIDESLLADVDKVTEDLKTTRSAFIRDAVRLALQQYVIRRLEEKHAQGYAAQPAKVDELEAWETEQAWGQP